MLRIVAGLLLALISASAYGQSSILQGGSWTAGRVPMYFGTGSGQATVQDSGPAGGGVAGLGIKELLLTARGTGTPPFVAQGTGPGGTNFCNFDAPTSNATGYHYLCMSPNATVAGVTGSIITAGAGGPASNVPLYLCSNGTCYTPGGTIAGLTVGTTTISGGTSNGMLYNLSGVLANTNSLANALLVTNGSGAPSFSTSLPSGTTIPASRVLYTPPGTGGVVQTQQTYDQRVLWAADYGAVCDGVTNDTPAFQALINEAMAINVPARFLGTCKINTSLSITSLIDFGGYGLGRSVLVPATGVTAIVVNTIFPILLHDFDINYSVANAGNLGITITGSTHNSGSRFDNLFISQASTGIQFDRAELWVVSRTVINQFGSIGIAVQNTNNSDAGDSTIYGSLLIGAVGATTGVYYQNSGGLRFENNKINGTSLPSGIELNLAAGSATGILQIVGNSIEGISTSGYGVYLHRQSTTGTFGSVIISNNEFGVDPLKCVYVPTDATGVWLNEVIVANNTCSLTNSASAIAFDVDSVSGYINLGNAIVSSNAGSKAINIGSSAASCTLGINSLRGAFASDTGVTNCSLNLAGLRSGASGGIPYYSATGQLATSAALAANMIVLGGGAGVAPSTLGSLGTTTTVLHGNAAGAPTFGAVSLTADVTGTLPVGNGGLGIASGTSGGLPYFSGSTTIASSAALGANCIVYGGGAGVAPATSSSTCPTVSSAGVLAVTNTTNSAYNGTISSQSLTTLGGAFFGGNLFASQVNGYRDINGVGDWQVAAIGNTNKNKQVWFGFDTTNNRGFLQALIQGTSFNSVMLNPLGGNVVVGAQSNGSFILDVTGTAGISGNTTLSGGNLIFGTATKTVVLKQGANGTVGTFVCTSGGTITINNTNVAITDAIIISLNTVGGTISTNPTVNAITAATSFTAKCATSDTSTYNYAIIKNAAWLLERDLNPANDNHPMYLERTA